MADQTPSTAYSDPFYDRLERTFHWLGRRWLIVVAAIIVAVIIAVSLRYSAATSPEAASAAALHQAQQGGQRALATFAADEEFTPESRARAALSVSQQALEEGDLERSLRFARLARDLAEESTLANLRAAAHMTLAATLEANGDVSEAIEAYRWVVSSFRGQLTTYTRSADVSAALLLADKADSNPDPEEATEQRREALNILADYANSDPRDGGEIVIAAATWRYYQLRRNFPELSRQLDQELGLESDDHAVDSSEDPALEMSAPAPDLEAELGHE